MRPTDIARALFTSLFFMPLPLAVAQHIAQATFVKSIHCTPKNHAALEKRFCDAVTKRLNRYKPQRVAANRTLFQTAIEFAGWSEGDKIPLASVLVTDPIGKNTVKLIFAPPVGVEAAASRTLVALGQILQMPATIQNVGWIVTVPIEPPAK